MARPSMKFAEIKTPGQRDQLIQMWKTHPHHYTRMRAHAVLLSSQRYTISSLVEIFDVDRDSVSSWIDRFEAGGVDALRDPDRPGGPQSLDEDE